MATQKKRRLVLDPDRPAYGGVSIARAEDGRVVMIHGAIPGETVEVQVTEEKHDYLSAEVVEVRVPSPDRVTPACEYYGVCGGCQLQHIGYGRQVALKEQVLTDVLKRIGRLELTLDAPLVGGPWKYRHRGQFKVSGGHVGFYRQRSRYVVDVNSCPLMDDKVDGLYKSARPLVAGPDVDELHISAGNEAVALLMPVKGAKPDWKALSKSLMTAGFAGVVIEFPGGRTREYGQGRFTLDLGGHKYAVSARSFFQSNWSLNLALVDAVMDGLSPLGGKTVLDLYAGGGNFALPLSHLAGRVIAVEENPAAVKDGGRNVELGGVDNCRFIRSTVERLMLDEPVDAAVVDPPRQGLTDGALKKLMDIAPGRIAYVSCNPATFARDLGRLGAAYEVESVRLVDFFPQTYHMEALAFLSKR